MKLFTFLPIVAAFAIPSVRAEAWICRPISATQYVEFMPGSATPKSRDWLSTVVGMMGPLPLPENGTIEIIGHAASAGDPEREFQISKERAEVVAAAFTAAGFDENSLIVVWRGAMFSGPERTDPRVQVNRQFDRPNPCLASRPRDAR